MNSLFILYYFYQILYLDKIKCETSDNMFPTSHTFYKFIKYLFLTCYQILNFLCILNIEYNELVGQILIENYNDATFR